MGDSEKALAEARKVNDEAMDLYQNGKPAEAVAKMEQVLVIYRKLFPAAQNPDGHEKIALSLSNLGAFTQAAGDFDRALKCFEESLAMRRKLYPISQYPSGHKGLALSLNNLASVYNLTGRYETALPYIEEALAMQEKLFAKDQFPNGHANLALALNNLGVLHQEMGDHVKAQVYMEKALAMRRSLYPASQFPSGHVEIAFSLMTIGLNHLRAGQLAKALDVLEQGLALNESMYPPDRFPQGHPYLAFNLQYLASAHAETQNLEKAISCNERALAIRKALYPSSKYPSGHVEIAKNLNNLGVQLWQMKQYDKALDCLESSLEMNRRLFPVERFPDGNLEIAFTMGNLNLVHCAMGHRDEALSYSTHALAMRAKLLPKSKFPAGHPDLATALNNQATMLHAVGRWEEARPLFKQAIEMYQDLYPKSRYPEGHPLIAGCLERLARFHASAGDPKTAVAVVEETLRMHHSLLNRELPTASEATAFELINAQSRVRDLYFTLLPEGTASAEHVYDTVWSSRSVVTRMLERRHANARAAGTEHEANLERLRVIRRRTEQLLQEKRLKPSDRDQLLAQLADERDRLERDLSAAIPVLKRWQERNALGPTALHAALPAGTAFIDVMLYNRNETNPAKEFKLTPSYQAIVMVPGRPLQRVDLGTATAISDAIQTWRNAIDRRAISPATADLRRRVWEPLAAQLPREVKTVYVCADGDLSRMPWAALPGSQANTVLLEEYAFAVVPHGPFLLEQLRFPHKYDGSESQLNLGDVNYGASQWPSLPGTRGELQALSPLAPVPPRSLTQLDATAARLTELLPKVRFAHLATHGEFKADELAAEKNREREVRQDWHLGANHDSRRAATRNPLGFIGLVLANGDVMTGLSLVDLPLENLKLVTLSACETGLGELTGGEGVQGLQRAFHLAGCPNVIASLWKVNDAATAALMAKFYHELWVNKKEPLAALREAQLTIYHHPELIPDLTGERGAPKFKDAVAVKASDPAKPQAARADTKLWAAFVLSGVGK